jgi:hypothetical protein
MALNFPSSPSDGQVFGDYVYSASVPGWRKQANVPYAAPAGTIATWPTASPPFGWFIADGTAVSRTTYGSLYNIIGTSYGVGDGVTTFNLPNIARGTQAGILGRSSTPYNASTASASSVPLGPGLSVTVPIIAGRRYRVTFDAGLVYSTVANDRVVFMMRAGGTDIKAHYAAVGTTGGPFLNFDALYDATTTGNMTFDILWARNAGSGTITLDAASGTGISELIVEDMAETSSTSRMYSIIKWSAGVTPGDSELATRTVALEARKLSGLVPLSPASVVVSGGGSTASVAANGEVLFNNTTSLLLNGIFSAAYRCYLVRWWVPNVNANYAYLRLATGGVVSSAAAWYTGTIYRQSTTISYLEVLNGATNMLLAYLAGPSMSSVFEIENPYNLGTPWVSMNPVVKGRFGYSNTNHTDMMPTGMWNGSGLFDGMYIFPGDGVMGGRMRVYGYN